MRFKLLGALLALSVSTGCAQLKVEVDVLDKTYLGATLLDAGLRAEANDLLLGDSGQRTLFISTQKENFVQYQRRCYDQVLAVLGTESPVDLDRINDIRDARDMIVANADRNFARREDELARVDDAARTVLLGSFNAGARRSAEPLPGDVRNALLTRRGEYFRLVSDLYAPGERWCQGISRPPAASESRAEQRVDSADETVRAEAQVQASAAAARVITGHGRLLVDRPEAWVAANAPSTAWGEPLNVATVTGWGGGTDIAIKMNATGDFSVKGFTFDGRSTADMVSKIGGETLRLVAAAYGAPIRVGSSTPETPAAVSGSAIAAQIANQEAAEEEDAAYRAALFRMADTILADPTGLTNGNVAATTAAQGALRHLERWRSPEAGAD